MEDGLLRRSEESRDVRYSELKDLSTISPGYFIHTLNELTESERRLLTAAVSEPGRAVSLIAVVKRYLGGRHPYYQNKHQGEVDMMRAARRLWNRGLASISKVDGLNTITIDEGRVRQAIRRELAAKAPGEGDVYLIKGTCKTQTSLSQKVSGPLKSTITGMPRRCSNHRLGACRHLKGIRWMSESDRETIASYYNSYINDIDEKIIALLDGRTDVMLGMEYSTRFNDMNKAKRNLDNFEDVIRASFNLNNKERKAVFLTLTSDPNLPDEERRELEAKRLADLERRIAACTTSGAYLSHLIADRYRILGPDREIADLESINRNPEQEVTANGK